jgi:hypothetical protein
MTLKQFALMPENNDPLPTKLKIAIKRNLRHSWTIRLLKRKDAPIWLTLFGLFLACACVYVGVKAEEWWMKEKVVSVPGIGVRTAKAAEEVEWPDIGDCEQYRPIVEKYFGKLTDEALFVAKNESGCIADRVGNPNSDGTRDYCLFQINKEKLTAQSLDVCVRRAYEKYTAGRIGEKNWSAFYAVCDVNAQPKYPKTIKNCS